MLVEKLCLDACGSWCLVDMFGWRTSLKSGYVIYYDIISCNILLQGDVLLLLDGLSVGDIVSVM